jgi:transposase InsO family protein
MCHVFNVSRSGYYKWLCRKPSTHKKKDNVLKKKILDIYHEGRGFYGSPRIHRRLAKKGYNCSKKRVERLMKELGIAAKQKRKFKATTDSNHNFPVAANHLQRNFTALRPNQSWASDITYIRTKEGWLYLAAIMDLYSRKIVGWAMEKRLNQDLVIKALNMAIARRRPFRGLILHSDRGSQYASHTYQSLLQRNGIICSMSRKGDCWDNAVMESFFHTLKVELVYYTTFITRSQARRSIFEYIEVFYNRTRLHSSIGYNSPEEYEKARKAA